MCWNDFDGFGIDSPIYASLPSNGRRGRLIGSLGYILMVLGRGAGPSGEKMAATCLGTNSQDLVTILDPFQSIFAN